MRNWTQLKSVCRALLHLGLKADHGNVAVVFALTLPVLVGGLGYGVETGYWYLARNRMQGAADAAAHAGAMEARTGATLDEIRAAAIRAANDNGFTTAANVTVNNPPSIGAGGPNAVEVMLNTSMDRVFTGIFNSAPVTLNTRSVARFNTASTACILALDPLAGSAANFAGNTDVELTGCSVMSNSVANNAINVQGSAQVSADCLIAVGGVSLTSGATMTQCAAAVTNSAPVADPFRNVPVPPTPGGCQNDNGANRSPGRYCSGMTLKNNVTLQPGVYVIEGDDFRINANADVTGTGVTFYLKSGVHLVFNGNAKMTLQAPTSGAYSGMLIMGDRNATGTNKVNGTADSLLTGAIYFKNQEVEYLGNFSGIGGCTQVVANTIKWSGSTAIQADCTTLGLTAVPAMFTVKLTE